MIAGLSDMAMMAAPWLIAAPALLAMARIALHDVFTFEIDFAWLGIAALCMLLLILAGDGDLVDALVAAGLFWLVTALLNLLLPGRIGQGDTWLMGFLGLAAGSGHALPVLAMLALLSLLTSACYSIARGKRLFRSMIPVALPGMGAGLLALILRMREAVQTGGGPPVPPGETVYAVIPGLYIIIGLVAVADIGRHRSDLAMRRSSHQKRKGRSIEL